MGEIERPPPPIVGKVTHYSAELYWTEALEQANKELKLEGDARLRVTIQEQDRNESWGTIYTGYSTNHVVEGLEPWTQYIYRIRFSTKTRQSEWSQTTTLSTTKEPLTGEHLHKAILVENIQDLTKVLESGDVSPDIPDKYGYSPLMQCAQKGYLEMVEILIEHGADVNFQNESGKTSLMMAAFSKQLAIVKELRHWGAKYDVKDKGGCTALHWAIDGNEQSVTEYILEDGADNSWVDCNGWTPLHRVAAITGNAMVAKTLLRNNAKVDMRDKDGKTPLMIAVINGHKDLVTLLLQHEADVHLKNEYGKSAYDMAVSMEKRIILKILDEHLKLKSSAPNGIAVAE